MKLDKNILGFSVDNSYLDEALYNYLIHGIEPGGFLTAVLANDLRLAVGRADHWNRQRFCGIVEDIEYNVPAASRSSYRAVSDWCANINSCRTQYADEMQKQYVMRVLKQEHSQHDIYEDPPF
jgi:hypothetical protein